MSLLRGPAASRVLRAMVGTALVALSASAQSASPADVAFMKGMIHHHAQAIEMVVLIADRTTSASLRTLGERIDISQRDEIEMMQQWLRARREEAPDPLPHLGMDMGDHDMPMMAGMLTKAQMAALKDARGPAFDRLFLSGMIQHHEGALTMVRELFATTGGGQETAIFRFASDIDADQRAEIARMRTMLRALNPP
ncbi:MAG: DUF305 domain-containing protein [Gemmatimonadetes bacterium]|nr:DUF305 domain-containing protein [Gemmatimonadota bacterium]